MENLFDLRNATFAHAKIEQVSDSTYQVPIKVAPDVSAYDDFDTGTIDATLWSPQGGVTTTEGPFLGVNCIQVAGPATPAWDTNGLIMKVPIVPTVGDAIQGQFIVAAGSTFAVGLQEYAYTVDNIVTPTTWTLKIDQVQTTDNSTYVLFETGRISILRGGTSGEKIIVPDSAWMVSDTTEVRPIYVNYVFTTNGYEIWVNQPAIWDEPKKIHTEVRSTSLPAPAGYSFCVNKNYSDNILGIHGIAPGFRDDAIISANVLVQAITTPLYARTLNVPYETGGIVGLDGDIKVQFPLVSPAWRDLATVALDTLTLTGRLVHPVNFKLIGDIVVTHPITINDEEPVT